MKSGRLFNSREAETMSFIAARTTIPVPKVYDTYLNEHSKCHIIMDYIPGEPLDQVWKSLTPEQKEATSRQLGGYIAQLQQLRGNRVEAVNGESVKIILGSGRESEGPFDTVKEFNNWLVDGVFNRITPPRFKENCRAALSDNHDICFAHGDFAPQNILVDETGCVPASLTGKWQAGFLHTGILARSWLTFQAICQIIAFTSTILSHSSMPLNVWQCTSLNASTRQHNLQFQFRFRKIKKK